MLCIFKGKKRIRDKKGKVLTEGRIAGDIQNDIHAQFGQCEHSNTIQHRKEGCFILVCHKETITEAKKRIRDEHKINHLPFDPATVVESDLQKSVVGEALSRVPHQIHISPSIKKDDGSSVTIEDFPDEFSFGNGVTANSSVTLKDGSKMCLTWCVLPENTIINSSQKTSLCSICES